MVKVVIALMVLALSGGCLADGLGVEVGEVPYLTYKGKPLLAFGPGDESRLISRDDPEAVLRWAKWQNANGMNLLRAYPTFVPGAANWGAGSEAELAGAFHPFNRKDGKWDVDSWNDEYFRNMGRFIGILEEHGIILHLQLWQIVYFKEDRPERWASNYVNPENNINEWTKAYPRGRDYMNAPWDSPAGKHRREWVRRVLDAVGDHRNVWIDVINELGNAGIGDMKWASEVVSQIRSWERENGRKLLVGVDMCNWNSRDFAAHKDEYDLLIFNELHRDKVVQAVSEFRKPAVTVRSSDGTNNRSDYLFLDAESVSPSHQTRYRTLCYRSIFSGVQSIGAYWKPEVSEADYAAMKDWPRYSRALRRFWGKIEPFRAHLVVDDSIVNKYPTPRAYGMRSEKLYCVYLECGPGTSGVRYPASVLEIACPFENSRVEIFDPRSGMSRLGKAEAGEGVLKVALPAFTEDLVVILRPR